MVDEAQMLRLLNHRVGDYHIDELLNVGGQAAIFRARHTSMNQTFALKVYGPFTELRDVDHEMEEARKMFLFDHPSILKIHPPIVQSSPLNEDETLLVIPMPLSMLGSAEEWMELRGRIGLPQIAHLRQLFDAVRAIHAANHSHNDLKPSNVLLFGDGFEKARPMIADFGVAKLTTFASKVSFLSPEYSPPEQFTQDGSLAGDVYSLGATVYYLVTGRHPISVEDTDNMAAWQAAHQKTPRPDATAINERCPVRIALLIMRMMDPDRATRPTIEESLAELDLAATEIHGDEKGYPLSNTVDAIVSAPTETLRYYTSKHRCLLDPSLHRAFGRDLWIVRIALATNRWDYIAKVFRIATTFFGESFSFYETYGHYDVLVRVWSRKERLDRFMRAVSTDAGDAEVDEHRVEEVLYPQRRRDNRDDVSMTVALAAQERVRPFGVDPSGRIIGEFDSPPSWKIKAFTFVLKPRTHAWRSTVRRDVINGLRWRSGEIFDSRSAHAVCVFTEPCSYLCMIEYGATEFSGLSNTPSVMSTQDKGPGYGTNTLLATNRLVYESDQIRL